MASSGSALFGCFGNQQDKILPLYFFFLFFWPNPTEKKIKNSSQMGGKLTVGLAAPQPGCCRSHLRSDALAAQGWTRREEISLQGQDGGRHLGRADRTHLPVIPLIFHSNVPSSHPRLPLAEVKDFSLPSCQPGKE